MSKMTAKHVPVSASSNWLALKKKLSTSTRKDGPAHKRRKIEHTRSPSPLAGPSRISHVAIADPVSKHPPEDLRLQTKNGESLHLLRRMIYGEMEYSDTQQLPGKYLALDCEMVGVGIDGSESSLARVSIVNYYGAVQLDEFVRQRERVIDYRTQFSGVRAADVIKAKPFEEVQRRVAELLKDRILIGHAVSNDLKALLLSHPRPQTRDTQYHAAKFKITRSRYIALRNLVKQELDVTIQSGEHSSITDARATMAVYRLHRKEWERNRMQSREGEGSKKRKRATSKSLSAEGEDDDDDEGDEGEQPAKKSALLGQGRKGVSSGLSTVIRRGVPSKAKAKWWKELGGVSKGSVSLKAG